MVSRRGWLALALSTLAMVGVVVPLHVSGATRPIINANENAHTLVLSLPGPFNGCTYLDAGATATTDAILDLIRPSAFLTNADGTLVGEAGPIVAAELTSLQPETVRYTIAAKQKWSNGAPFSGADLVAWWRRAKVLASVASDGYRAIRSLSVSSHGLVVKAVFARPYADWNLLFRDVEAAGTSSGCAIGSLLTRPSLGPYRVFRATTNRVVLTMDPSWSLDPNRFGRVVLTDNSSLPTKSGTDFVSFSNGLSRTQIQTISAEPALSERIAASSNIEELTFAPASPVTRSLVVRKALSWSIVRQDLIDRLFGDVTYLTAVAASALYSQSQSQYPGGGGSGPSSQSSTTTVPPTAANGLSDCVACALAILRQNGFRHTATGWRSASGLALRVRLAVGPSALDHSVAHLVEGDWAAIGVAVTTIGEASDELAARAAATDNADVAIFARPTSSTPSYAARSWAGPPYADSFPSGVRLPGAVALFNQASTIFNPVTASATWLLLDQLMMTDYWVRPLFTPPSLVVWSSSLASVQSTFTLPGFVDELPAWSVVPPVPQS